MPIRSISLASMQVPILGQGTWGMGEDRRQRDREVRSLRLGLDLGMSLIDTAEMYGEGGAEEVVGEAIAGRRDECFLVSKVYPHNAGRRSAVEACERSLKRLGTDRMELYLLHWRGGIPLAETVETFERLKEQGKIRAWGVSNLDPDDMAELMEVPGGEACAVNQVLYNLTRRGIEWDLLPWCVQRSIPVMAYSPIEQGRMPAKGALRTIADRLGATLFQVALAWVLRHEGVVAIPKASDPDHVKANRAAADLVLSEEDLVALDRVFPPPTGPRSLEML
ncbi:aldo/keto reductase [Skermanella mucosa]|uniref:aldo/keto reductase n=1 Tax=Skermanella mucosa TaxID=1789672 RepID=UPI00192C0721|nr:aldo/keto reductase [Skermanella mucosa]UEM23854.1 aldo/keto reductase [Skermanella mucosa]